MQKTINLILLMFLIVLLTHCYSPSESKWEHMQDVCDRFCEGEGFVVNESMGCIPSMTCKCSDDRRLYNIDRIH